MKLERLKQIVKESLVGVLTEASYKRTVSHLEKNLTSFVMISAYRNKNSRKLNKHNQAELRSMLHACGFPYVNMFGGTTEDNKDVHEASILVLDLLRPDIEKSCDLFQTAVQIAQKFNQDSFIYGEPLLNKSGEKARMYAHGYDKNGQSIEEPWAGPWSSITMASNDDVYWSRVKGKKFKLTELHEFYQKMPRRTREDCMKVSWGLRATKAALESLAKHNK